MGGRGLERILVRYAGRSLALSTTMTGEGTGVGEGEGDRVGEGVGEEEGEGGMSCARYPCATRITAPLRSEYIMTCCGSTLAVVGKGSGCVRSAGGELKREGGEVTEDRSVGEVGFAEGAARAVGEAGGREGVEGRVNCEVNEKVLPLPSSLCTQIRPPNAATI